MRRSSGSPGSGEGSRLSRLVGISVPRKASAVVASVLLALGSLDTILGHFGSLNRADWWQPDSPVSRLYVELGERYIPVTRAAVWIVVVGALVWAVVQFVLHRPRAALAVAIVVSIAGPAIVSYTERRFRADVREVAAAMERVLDTFAPPGGASEASTASLPPEWASRTWAASGPLEATCQELAPRFEAWVEQGKMKVEDLQVLPGFRCGFSGKRGLYSAALRVTNRPERGDLRVNLRIVALDPTLDAILPREGASSPR